MAIGFKFYGESRTITYDLDRGLSWCSNSKARELEPNGLVASEKTVWDYLIEHGADSMVKSVKLGEPKFPKNREAKDCNSWLRLFTQGVLSEDFFTGRYRDALIKYCGVEIDYQLSSEGN